MRQSVYPHNDILNAAYYHLDVIRDKVENNVEDAISLDCFSCLILSAASIEALLNFVGHKKIKKWKERAPAPKKMNIILKHAGLEYKEANEPLVTLIRLRDIRNAAMHATPLETMNTDNVALDVEWAAFLTPDYCEHAFSAVKTFQREVFEGSGIEIGESLSSAIRAGS